MWLTHYIKPKNIVIFYDSKRGVYNFGLDPHPPPQPQTKRALAYEPKKLQPKDISLLESLGIVLSQYLLIHKFIIDF